MRKGEGRRIATVARPLVAALVALVALVALAALAACSGDDDGTPGPTTTSISAATSTPSVTSGGTTAPSVPAGMLAVQVFFLDRDAFNVGVPPYVAPVTRVVEEAGAPRAALDALFAGPTPEESDGGLELVTSGATGIDRLDITDGTAHVFLAGGCSSGGSTFTVANEIVPTLVQFTEVDSVKIYDPDGSTQAPDEPGDSIPTCLEP